MPRPTMIRRLHGEPAAAIEVVCCWCDTERAAALAEGPRLPHEGVPPIRFGMCGDCVASHVLALRLADLEVVWNGSPSRR